MYRFLVRRPAAAAARRHHVQACRAGIWCSAPPTTATTRRRRTRTCCSRTPEAASELAPDSVREALGDAYRPIQPERQDVYEVGCAVRGRRGGSRIDVLGLPQALARSAGQQQLLRHRHHLPHHARSASTCDGAEAADRRCYRYTASRDSLSATTGRAISTPPFTGGLFLGQDAVDLLSRRPLSPSITTSVLGMHGLLTVDPARPRWLSGHRCATTADWSSNPSDPLEVAADPDYRGPAALREPHGQPAARAAAHDRRSRRRHATSRTGAAARPGPRSSRSRTCTNRTALYNFQSVFVGTRLVQPRTVSLRLVRHF